MNRTILTITGPSASGKSTLEHMLTADPASPFARIISTTTRMPRKGEVNGKDYHFVDEDDFQALDKAGLLMESNLFGRSYYGARVSDFESVFAQGKIAVLVADPNGVKQIAEQSDKRGYSLAKVFVSNPAAVRYERLVERFIRDIERLELGGHAFELARAAFVARLATIETVETQWFGALGWNLCYRNFDSSNADQVAQSIANAMLSGSKLRTWSPASLSATRAVRA